MKNRKLIGMRPEGLSRTVELVGVFVAEHSDPLHLAHPALAEVLAQIAFRGVVGQLADEQFEVVVLSTLVLWADVAMLC